jgi:hypothetical protein
VGKLNIHTDITLSLGTGSMFHMLSYTNAANSEQEKSSLSWMHKYEQLFNLCVSLQHLVTYIPLSSVSKASDCGSAQKQVHCVGHILPVGK